MCNPSSGAGAFSARRRRRQLSRAPGQRQPREPRGGAACTVKKRASGRSRGHGLASPLDPHFDVAAFQFELGDVLLD